MLPRSDAQVLTNEHIRRMTSAGLPPAVIVAKITSSETNFDTSVDALILLASGGVDSAIIEAMTMAGVKRPASRDGHQSAGAPAGLSTTPCESAGIFVEQPDGLMRGLEWTAYASTKPGGLVTGLTRGALTSKMLAVLRRTASSVRLADRSPVFWFCFDASDGSFELPGIKGVLQPHDIFLIPLKINEKRDHRSWVRGRQDRGIPKRVVPMSYEEVAHGVFRVTPHNPLAKNEYAFYKGPDAVTSRHAYSFGIE